MRGTKAGSAGGRRGKEEQRRKWKKEGKAEGDRANGKKREGERKQRRGWDRWKDSTRDEEFRYALSSTVGRIKISSRRWRRYTVLEPLPFCAWEKRERPLSTATTPRSQNSLTETCIGKLVFAVLLGNISGKFILDTKTIEIKFQFQEI